MLGERTIGSQRLYGGCHAIIPSPQIYSYWSKILEQPSRHFYPTHAILWGDSRRHPLKATDSAAVITDYFEPNIPN